MNNTSSNLCIYNFVIFREMKTSSSRFHPPVYLLLYQAAECKNFIVRGPIYYIAVVLYFAI